MTHLAAIAASALLTAIWQGTLLALVVALCLRLLPGLSAAVRSAVWLAVFATVFALHFIPTPHAAAQPHAVHAAPIWSLILAAAWLTLSLVRATQLLLSTLRLRAVSRRCTPLRAPFIEPLSLSMSGSTPNSKARPYTLCTSPDVDRPSVLGFRNPRILLPPGLAEKLTPSELQQVLLHETEHLRRSDDWTNLLQKLALVLFPLNPVLLWVERRLCLERELACDDRVLLATGARKAYATCLTQLAEHSILHRSLTLALGALGNRHRQSELAARVHRILRRPEQLLSPAKTRLATATLLLGVLATSATLARTPRLITFTPTANPETATVAAIPATEAGAPGLASETWVPTPTLAKVERTRSKPVPARAILTSTRVQRTPAHPATRQNSPRAMTIGWHYEYAAQQVQTLYVPAVAFVPATYAVATPDGWIIFQL